MAANLGGGGTEAKNDNGQWPPNMAAGQ